MSFTVEPIGSVTSSRDAMLDDDWGGVEATITLAGGYDADSLQGLGIVRAKEVDR